MLGRALRDQVCGWGGPSCSPPPPHLSLTPKPALPASLQLCLAQGRPTLDPSSLPPLLTKEGAQMPTARHRG